MLTPPTLFTFDIFGTVLDWRSGLRSALGARGLSEAEFDAVIDRQAVLEQAGRFRPYAELVAQSLVEVLDLEAVSAARIGAEVGRGPLFPDSAAALRRLQALAPCVATTNSDRAHGAQVQAQLGFALSGWLCAEELRLYKPDARVWQLASERLGVKPGPHWWHVSAYGDYDLEVGRLLGLTCAFIERPHARPGPHDLAVPDLAALADRAESLLPR